jgi:hypothetical protein
MTDVTITPITSGYNLSRLNTNLNALALAINNEVVHTVGGNNVMQQALDLNGFPLLNIGTDVLQPGSFVSVADLNAAILTHKVETEPMTTLGDFIIGGPAGVPARLGVGAPGYVIKSVGGVPTWAVEAGAGGGGIVDAPIDGQEYLRQDGAWVNPTPQPTILPMFYRNAPSLPASYTVLSGGNESVIGPLTIPDGMTLTIEDGARLVIL